MILVSRAGRITTFNSLTPPMTITPRPVYSHVYAFALNLYTEAVRPLASAWIEWVDADQKAQFASL